MNKNSQPIIELKGSPSASVDGFTQAELINRAADRRQNPGRRPIKSFSDVISHDDRSEVESLEENLGAKRQDIVARNAGADALVAGAQLMLIEKDTPSSETVANPDSYPSVPVTPEIEAVRRDDDMPHKTVA